MRDVRFLVSLQQRSCRGQNPLPCRTSIELCGYSVYAHVHAHAIRACIASQPVACRPPCINQELRSSVALSPTSTFLHGLIFEHSIVHVGSLGCVFICFYESGLSEPPVGLVQCV